MEKIKEYHRAQLFDGIDTGDAQHLLGQCETLWLNPGDVLLSPEMDNGSLFYLVEGEMSVHLGDITNPALDVFRAGECAGELSFLDGKRPSAYVVASDRSEVLKIDAQVLTGLVQSSHRVAINLIHILTSRMRFGLGKLSDTYEN